MKFLILENLCKMEAILFDVYDDECSCNEGSLTDNQLSSVLYCINEIRRYLEDENEKY